MAATNRSTLRTAPTTTTYGYGAGVMLAFLNIVITAVFWWQLPPQIPLFYSLPYGVNQLASKVWLLMLPVLSVFIWINYVVVSKLMVKSTIYISLLKWLHLLGIFLITIALIHILAIIL